MKALVDTGASLTVVNPEVAATWKLRHTGFVQVSAAGHTERYPQYAARMTFPGTRLKVYEVIPVVACKLPGQPISCLIGRDVLRRWQFSYNGPTGEYSISEP